MAKSPRPSLTTLRSRVQPQPHRLATIQPGSWRTANQSSAQRGYGYRWQKAREAHLLANPLCVMCKEQDGRAVPATIVDHRIPHGGDQCLFWDRSNWQSLCAHHHSSDKQRQEAADRAIRDASGDRQGTAGQVGDVGRG
ncbi:HNH endonuclease, partial [Variovorax sp. JS1663]|uniref:HNH endonuclease n=1 Tax=Variovorax sp. JS1663 TaxID=1851577 RepID=UPI000B75FDAC